MAQWRAARDDEPLLGAGRLAVNVDTGEHGQQFQGIVPLVGPELRNCLEAYFTQSEQLPTRLYLLGDDARVAGLLLQALPNAAEHKDAFETVMAPGTMFPSRWMGLSSPVDSTKRRPDEARTS